MDTIFNKINDAKHIMIVTDEEHLALASALYTYILREYKKVSLVVEALEVDKKFSFLPWYDKIRTSKVTSCDFMIEVRFSCTEFYKHLKNSKIKINQKMATALYAGILIETDGFLRCMDDGITFAIAKELIECGADYKSSNKNIRQRTTLSHLRLKAIMLKEMLLVNSAKRAVFYICQNDLDISGALIKDCDLIMQESLKLPYVEEAVLLDRDTNDKIIKIIRK
jgi:phosphoesterase RecJ-like protein